MWRRIVAVQIIEKALSAGIMKITGITLYPSMAIARTLAVKAVISSERKIK
jgi:hypothetical protein